MLRSLAENGANLKLDVDGQSPYFTAIKRRLPDLAQVLIDNEIDTMVVNEEGRTITWKLNRDYVHNQMKTMKRLGVRDDINSLDIDDYIDLSYFDNCGAKDFDTFIKEEVDPIFPLGMSYEEWRAKAVEVDNIKEESKV